MFIVLSYDSNYNRTIRLHSFTEFENVAKECFHAVCDAQPDYLVECVKMNGEVNRLQGYPLFWDNFRTQYEGMTLVLSNNRESLESPVRVSLENRQ